MGKDFRIAKSAICDPKFTEEEFDAEYGNVSELTGYLSNANRVLWPVQISQNLGDNTLGYQDVLETRQ